MKVSREWATPMAMGGFGLMACTGILMFFHLDSGLNKPAHEWLGWLFVAGVALHGWMNWMAVKRHLASKPGRIVLGIFALVIAASFISPPAKPGEVSPSNLAMRGILRAPLAQVAPLTGRPLEQLQRDLAAAGIAMPDAQSSLDKVIREDRELRAKAMQVLFGAPKK